MYYCLPRHTVNVRDFILHPLIIYVLPSKTALRHKIYINNKYFVENHIVIDDEVPIQKKKNLLNALGWDFQTYICAVKQLGSF